MFSYYNIHNKNIWCVYFYFYDVKYPLKRGSNFSFTVTIQHGWKIGGRSGFKLEEPPKLAPCFQLPKYCNLVSRSRYSFFILSFNVFVHNYLLINGFNMLKKTNLTIETTMSGSQLLSNHQNKLTTAFSRYGYMPLDNNTESIDRIRCSELYISN